MHACFVVYSNLWARKSWSWLDSARIEHYKSGVHFHRRISCRQARYQSWQHGGQCRDWRIYLEYTTTSRKKCEQGAQEVCQHAVSGICCTISRMRLREHEEAVGTRHTTTEMDWSHSTWPSGKSSTWGGKCQETNVREELFRKSSIVHSATPHTFLQNRKRTLAEAKERCLQLTWLWSCSLQSWESGSWGSVWEARDWWTLWS